LRAIFVVAAKGEGCSKNAGLFTRLFYIRS
jgi:hypothetical protein